MSTETKPQELEQELASCSTRDLRARRRTFARRPWSPTSRCTRRPRATPRPGGRSSPRDLDWFDRADRRCSTTPNPPFYKWFADGKLNASYNCLDRHVEAGHGDRVAFHWRGEEGEERDVTYADLHRDVQRLANVLSDRGVEAGDVVGIYLPMIPEVVVAMLACARIGAPHNVVFGGFSPDAVKERMQFSEAKALITVDAARRKGKSGRDQARGRRVPRRGAVDRDRDRGPQHRRRGRR